MEWVDFQNKIRREMEIMDGMGQDRQARTAAIMDKFQSLPDEQPQGNQIGNLVAAEDIKAGDQIEVKGGMAYPKTPAPMGGKDEMAGAAGQPAPQMASGTEQAAADAGKA